MSLSATIDRFTAAFPLEIFPPGLDHSIIVAVWVGMVCLFLVTESFGWVWVGLVVPGYLAAIFISSPVSAVATLVEAVLTWALVHLHAEELPRLGVASPAFGRDRFFLCVLWGTAVRVTCEGWLFAGALESLSHLGPFTAGVASWEPDLFGIGLVLVPLTANAITKAGLVRGTTQVALITFFTWAVLRGVLLPLTNLSLTDFQFLYGNVARSVPENAKVYIILLTGCLLAARAHLRYGWEFNILIPALLGVAWLWPIKIAATVVEAIALMAACDLLVRLPGLRRLDIEGPRRVLFIFTLDLAYKWAVIDFAPEAFPRLESSDVFGFGYVLPSLIAARLWTRREIWAVLLPTLMTSLTAFVVGSGLAWGLTRVPLPWFQWEREHPADRFAALAPVGTPTQDLTLLLLRGGRAVAPTVEPLSAAAGLDTLVRALVDHAPPPDVDGAPGWQAAAWAARMGTSTFTRDGHRWQAFFEEGERFDEQAGRGVWVWREDGADLTLVVPPPAPGVWSPRTLAAPALADALAARLVVVPGAEADPTAEGGLQPTHAAIAAGEALRAAPRLVLCTVSAGQAEGLYVPGRLPEALDLHVLRAAVGPVPLLWRPAPAEVSRWSPPGEGPQATLCLRAETWLMSLRPATPAPPVEGLPPDWARRIERGEAPVALSTPNRRALVPPSELRLLVWQEELLAPLLESIGWGSLRPHPPDPAVLAALQGVAAALGYRLREALGPAGEPLVVLEELSPTRFGATLLLRPTGGRPWVFEVPAPDATGLVGLGQRWLGELDGQALLIAGAVRGRQDFDLLDVLSDGAPEGPFRAAHRALVLGGVRQGVPPTSLLLVATSWERMLPGDLAIATPSVAPAGSPVPHWLEQVGEVLAGRGLDVAWNDGAAWGASLRPPASGVVRYSREIGEGRLGFVWVPPRLRLSAGENLGEVLWRAGGVLGVKAEEGALRGRLGGAGRLSAAEVAAADRALGRAVDAWRGFLRREEVGEAQALVAAARGRGGRVVLLRDPAVGRLYLLGDVGGRVGWCLDLSTLPPLTHDRFTTDPAAFLEGRAPVLWLLPGEPSALEAL